jgi:hypothetical protein
MAIQKVLEEYGELSILLLIPVVFTDTCKGDVVRIAPNEVVFLNPQAALGTQTCFTIHYNCIITDRETRHLCFAYKASREIYQDPLHRNGQG